MSIQPKFYKMVSGIGTDIFPLVAFDKALAYAGVSNYNLIKVSSVLPPHCQESTEIDLPEGSVLYAAFAVATTKNGLISTAVSITYPQDLELCGAIFEMASDALVENEIRQCALEMGVRAFSLKGREILEQKITSISTFVDNKEEHTASFSAVVMW